MDQDFIVRTHREGTLKTDDTIESLVTKMGQNGMGDRALGSVVAVVEKVRGEITKNKLNWAGDDKFRASQEVNAKLLLDAVASVVKGGGDDEELKVKVKTKL